MANKKSNKRSKFNAKERTQNPKRAQLISLSEMIRLKQALGKLEEHSTLNESIKEHYQKEAQNDSLEFKTFHDWKNAGYKIKAGSTAYLFWGRKREATSKKTVEVNNKQEETTEKYKFFPLAYCFSSEQVEKRK